jgi:hypothetical protein
VASSFVVFRAVLLFIRAIGIAVDVGGIVFVGGGDTWTVKGHTARSASHARVARTSKVIVAVNSKQ